MEAVVKEARDDFKTSKREKALRKKHKVGINRIRETLRGAFSRYKCKERETHIAKRIIAAVNFFARLLRHGVEQLIVLISIHELGGFV